MQYHFIVLLDYYRCNSLTPNNMLDKVVFIHSSLSYSYVNEAHAEISVYYFAHSSVSFKSFA